LTKDEFTGSTFIHLIKISQLSDKGIL